MSEMRPGSDGAELTAREAFALKCLNAAANLYGILSMDSFCEIYNHYAKGKEPEIAAPMCAEEAEMTARDLRRRIRRNYGGDMDKSRPQSWYAVSSDCDTGESQVVHETIYDEKVSSGEKEDYDDKRRRVASWKDEFYDLVLKFPEEGEFFANAGFGEYPENAGAAEALVKSAMEICGIDRVEAEDFVFYFQFGVREDGPFKRLIAYCVDYCFNDPALPDAKFKKLCEACETVRRTTRAWALRGRTLEEARDEGVDVAEFEDAAPSCGACEADGGRRTNLYEDRGFSGDDDFEEVNLEDLPPARLAGSFDFQSVKDPDVRDRLLWEQEGMEIVVKDFLFTKTGNHLSKEERIAAAECLGLQADPETGDCEPKTNDDLAFMFAMLVGAPGRESRLERVLADREALDEYDRAAAAYFDNRRIAWLLATAQKSGLGYKCRDLLSGEELFLVAPRLSGENLKGAAIFAMITPIGEVYTPIGPAFSLGNGDPEAELKRVLSTIGLDAESALSMSPDNMKRFAAESVRLFAGLTHGGNSIDPNP